MFEKEAEKWVIDSVCKDCSKYEKCKSKEHCTCKECSKEKWQKGAEYGYNKANEWHDLRKNPEDTPNYDVIHYVLTAWGEQAYYDKNRKVWRDMFDEIRSIPIAWREIPRFEENE